MGDTFKGRHRLFLIQIHPLPKSGGIISSIALKICLPPRDLTGIFIQGFHSQYMFCPAIVKYKSFGGMCGEYSKPIRFNGIVTTIPLLMKPRI